MPCYKEIRIQRCVHASRGDAENGGVSADFWPITVTAVRSEEFLQGRVVPRVGGDAAYLI
jgi:hypothetical protein